MKSVLFVCTGNTCRSPLAEALFRGLTKGRDDIKVASAGTGAYSGQQASKHSVTLARERGVDLSTHRSKAVTIDLIETSTHIFALSRGHLASILDDFPEAEDKVYLVTEFVADDGLRGRDIMDPFGGDLDDYREVMVHLEKTLPSLLAYIDQTWKDEAGRGSTQGD